MSDAMEPELVTINEACQRCGVSRRTIYNWMGANKIQYIHTAGGCVRIVASSLFRAGNIPVESAA